MKKYLILTAIAIASLTACKTGTTIGKEDLTFPFGNRRYRPLSGGRQFVSSILSSSLHNQLSFNCHFSDHSAFVNCKGLLHGRNARMLQRGGVDKKFPQIDAWLKKLNL